MRIIASPVVSYIADHFGDRRRPLQWLAAGTLAGVMVWQFADGFWEILAIAVITSVFWTPVMPLIDSFAVAGARVHGLHYGRMRLWGSLSFVAASFIGGIVLKLSAPHSVIWMLLAAEIMMLTSALALPPDPRIRAAVDAPPSSRIDYGEVRRLLQDRRFLLLVGASSLVQATHAVYYGFGTLHWQKLGLGEDLIGALWAIGVIAEIILFAVSAPLLRRPGPAGLVLAGALLAMARWAITALDPPVVVLIVVQIAHAGSFAATFLGTVQFIGRGVPAHLQTTAQGIYAAFAGGLVMGLALLVAGPLYQDLAGTSYLVMAAVAGVAALLAFRLVMADRAAPSAAP